MILVEKDLPYFYEMEANGFVINDNLTFSIKAPSIVSNQDIQKIKEGFKRIDTLIRIKNESYNKYLDIESVAKNYLLDEIAYKTQNDVVCVNKLLVLMEIEDLVEEKVGGYIRKKQD